MNKPPSQKGRKRTKETKMKLRLSHLGKKPSLKTRKKMSETHKKNGTGKWMIGKKHSEITKKKMSEAHKGNQYAKGVIRSDEFKKQRSKLMIGKNNPRWKGGITPINLKIRQSIEYKQWRKDVFERDDYTCQNKNCSKRGGKLHADHIKPFALFPKLRFVINNGQTLCENCHKLTITYLNRWLTKEEYYANL